MTDTHSSHDISNIVKPLSKALDLSMFDCGRESLNEWLQKYAWVNHASDSAKTYVYEIDGKVLAYYSLSPGSVVHEEVVVRIGKGQPKKGRIPITLLARLAVDNSVKGKKIGHAMLKHALIKAIESSDSIGSRAVIVHALDDEAKSFYQRYDFEESPLNNSTLMVLMSDLRKAFK